ncbi:NUC189-domain-containing protein [Metschnikowia bicuspidata var. bicuspidata NRRL YB-4993]|uniref:NUC189-domain-containing protein n=1 Tax=Metschnikowia bicuspidata var. bicuspidata NRRL YB-4993 TaxID=869754 RepID=A0A1A0HK26_9ASCO|nr:NUC189-domain-containing protein [Metschnikowia bicuspidata var. bicuspidata NRRL YB-4993]OBA24375.1 NUC189-domain-containing protein [Metschnikowia bicuspidata var. bicuspidata NRRL YB-4993]
MSGPLIVSKFDPSNTHLALAVQALDTHQVKVQALVVSQHLLNTLFSLSKGQHVSALEWLSASELAVCLTNGSVLVYTPASNSIAGELRSPSSAAITDLHYSQITGTAWAADADGRFYEWDTRSCTLLQAFALADMLDAAEAVSKLSTVMYQDEPHLLVGTHNVYLVDVLAKSIAKTFPAHVQPVRAIVPVPGDADLFLTAAEGDRFINVYSISRHSTRAVLVAPAAVQQIALGSHGALSLVAAITETGTLEIFRNPLSFEAQPHEASKKRRKQLASSVQSKHADASIKYSRPEDEIRGPNDELLPVHAVSATASVLHTSWLESGAVSRFDAIPWHTHSGFALAGAAVVRKARQETRPTAHAEGGHDVAAPKLYHEADTVVTEGSAFQNDLVHSDDDDDETLAERLEKLSGGSQRRSALGKKKLRKHTAGTLTVVLSQALRNNDHSLLETVLANRDPAVVQNTISRLDSSLAVLLLDRLAERITRHQQRFDQMNFWLKWIIIVHGGVLSSMPHLHNKLASLHAVLTKKASTLPRLLELQGRLNMIEQQSSLKKEIMRGCATQDDYDDADTDVEYVEEIDDAVEAGLIDSDSEDGDMMDAVDDYEDDDDDNDDDDVHAAGLPENDDDGLSDVETAVVNNDVHEED